MADDIEKLILSISAETASINRALKRLEGDTGRSTKAVSREFEKMGKDVESRVRQSVGRANQILTNFGRGFVGGALGAGGLTAIAVAAREVTKSVAEIGDQAKRAGLSFRSFQELRHVAEQSRIGIDSLTDGLKELSLRADEFIVTGAGPGAESFRRLGYTAEELKEKLKDPAELLTEIIGRLQRLDKAAQIRIADEIFGGEAGERFVELVSRGEAGIRAMREQAHQLGKVLDDDIIRRAAEIDEKFNLISNTISSWVQPTVIRFLDDVLSLMDRIRPLSERMDGTINADIADLGRQRLDLERRMGEVRNNPALNERARAMALNRLQEELRVLNAQETAVMGVVKARQAENAAIAGRPEASSAVPFNTLPATDMTRAVQLQIARDRIKALESSGNYRAMGPVTADGDRAYGAYQVMGKNVGPWSQQVLGARLTPDQFLNNPAFQDRIFDAIFGDYIGKFGLEGAAQAWFGGPGAVGQTGRTDMLGTSVGAYGETIAAGIETAKDAWEGLRDVTAETATTTGAVVDQYATLEAVGVTALQGLATALADGKIEGRELLQIAIQVVQQLLQARQAAGGIGFGGGAGGVVGGLGSIVGSLFGFAKGGIAEDGRPLRTFSKGGVSRSAAIFGEAGPEAAVPLPDGRSIPVTLNMPKMPRAASAGSQNVHVTVGVSADNNGNLKPFVESVARTEASASTRAGIGSYDKQLPGRVTEVMERQGRG